MSVTVEQKDAEAVAPIKKKSRAGKVFRVGGVVLLLAVFLVIVINSLLVLFKDDYYTTFGKYRLFAIVSDSMEPAIPTGSMIVDKKPTSESEIKVGTVITFKVDNNGETILLTHRVVAVSKGENGKTYYTTRGDNAGNVDGYRPNFSDIVGIYTGKKCGFFGSLFGFFQSPLGLSVLIFCMFIIVIAWIVLAYIGRLDRRRKLENAALKKSAQALSNVNLRYDNINEITAVMDVLGMVSDEPRSYADSKQVAERLREFIKADNIELPQTPETAAVLDTLPAPDTPGALAAALSSGATLRQAEDGQTLVLTTVSGGKNILLTPVQTPDGIILCPQGVRVRSDLAPNIEDIGIMSMPASPEFFEGQPLEKNVMYPELPQPNQTFGANMLLRSGGTGMEITGESAAMSAPAISGSATLAAIGSAEAEERPLLESGDARNAKVPDKPTPVSAADLRRADTSARIAYAQYREISAQLELKQAEQLSELLAETSPLTYEERVRVAEYKAAHKKQKKPSKPRTPEQKAAAKEAAERRRLAQEAFLNALSQEDRDLYKTEQKLAKSREAAIRKLKRINADRKILDKIGD